MEILISINDQIQKDEILKLYVANDWSSAQKPELLIPALMNSHSLVTARYHDQLVGLGNAISDGYLVVYFPHMLVHPDFHRLGIGRLMMQKMLERYQDFHQKILVADGSAISFYEALGFERAGKTESMWIYSGKEH